MLNYPRNLRSTLTSSRSDGSNLLTARALRIGCRSLPGSMIWRVPSGGSMERHRGFFPGLEYYARRGRAVEPAGATIDRGRLSDRRSAARAKATVSTMNTTLAPNTQRGAPWSMIQPNSIGPIIPPVLRPIDTIPNARPTAPAGAAARTSMSRDGMIIPERNPAMPIAPTSTGA